MAHLIYPTLDLFLYDLREGLGQDDSAIAQKRDVFKRKLPAHLTPRIEQMDNTGETVELLGQERFERFSETHYEGYFYPVRCRILMAWLLTVQIKIINPVTICTRWPI